MKDTDCVQFLQWLLPQLHMRWPGFRKVRRQVCRRIDRRIDTLQLADVASYQKWIEEHPEELHVLDDFCRISISRFYRDRGVFDLLCEEILPALAKTAMDAGRRTLKCWSAGCASGEEPYTVNIVWKQAIAPQIRGVTLEIVATDSNPLMLERARDARYPSSSLKDLPNEWTRKCFVVEESEYRLRSEFHGNIQWMRQDIREQMPDELFDMIFCRHLPFTYFDQSVQLRVLAGLVERLRDGGVLVIGKQESLPDSHYPLTE